MGGRGRRGGAVGGWGWREEEVVPDLTGAPLEVLRGCVLRAIGWSALAGVILGAGHVALTVALLAVTHFPNRLALPGGEVRFFVLFGALQGAIAGLAVGVANGLVLGAVMLGRIVPRCRARRYRRLLGLVGATTTLLGLWGGRLLLGMPTLMGAGPAETAIGMVLAGLGGWWVGDRVARWYIGETIGWDRE